LVATGARLTSATALALGSACRAPVATSSAHFPAGSEIVVCGERVAVAAPVVLWTSEPHYDAHLERPRFASAGELGKRYRPGRAAADERLGVLSDYHGWTRALLAEQVDLFVLHYDACGTSRECFRVLQDERQLSVHFLLDLDGTIYQTLDLREQAWHARAANPRSIGIEIAQVGAFPPAERDKLARWYEWSELGTRITIPGSLEGGGLRTRGFVGRPARRELLSGAIHGAAYVQHDFTPEQYESLAALTAALVRVFPRIELDAPRDAEGNVRMDALSDAEEAAFHGVVGHYHLQTDKRDPGPAFDWERLFERARARLAAP
ncbi:MAG: N-acetylmuramoyl-L-alanine amidase, partial [Planctomycetes bacterium]|nr:N-acetylmuramoyl-L-alanine amidase [Planctomycetota bacterium]